ncbi:hypothetical protein UE46_15515 [Listeria weihenstephanensis]|uniref:Transposase n=1 Tax=Listeria weihenstephanensis TaxID=1006155 RepID=A0A1S7FY42_9LIST|nr:transposase [Listeria weihenstephanensis]AQY52285.1 hypothetical protein UE46_15515 [Listeria weihenstephanensis]
MAIIHQPTLFDMETLLTLEPMKRYSEIFSPLPLVKIVRLFDKPTRMGRPLSLNYEATFKALVIRYVEGIPTIKALVKRLNEDLMFKMNLRFLYSEHVPSEASFSRFTHVLSQHVDVLQTVNHVLLEQIDAINGLFSEQLAIDATHFSAHDKAHKTDNPKLPSVAEQLTMSSEDLMRTIPNNPTWSIKKNSKGKNMFWFGYKLHLAVSTTTQYIVGSLLSAAFVSDSSVAIPLLRQVTAIGSKPSYMMMDKGYDVTAIYHAGHQLKIEPIIDFNRRREITSGEVNEHFHPTCFLEYPYKYDSVDKRYQALKFTSPQDKCQTCPLRDEGMCQKVIKIKQTTNLRKYAVPARGTQAWEKLYSLRSAVERVNGYLKNNYQLSNVRFNGGKATATHVSLIQLTYNAVKFAVERLTKKQLLNV